MKASKRCTVLLKYGVLIEVDEDEIEEEAGEIHRLTFEIDEAIDGVLGYAEERGLGAVSVRILPLGEGTLNCGRCETCGGWTTDREKEDPILELAYGATVDGRLLCDEHLPADHRWAFLPGRGL